VREQRTVTPAQVTALVRQACPGWRAVRVWPLAGGVSAQVHAVEIEYSDGGPGRLVLRQYGAANLRADPHAAVTEYRLLTLLHEAGLPVPRPWLADESGAIGPGPCLLTEYIDGKTITDPVSLAEFLLQPGGERIADPPPGLAPFIGPMAVTLAALHSVGLGQSDVPFLPDAAAAVAARIATNPDAPDEALSEPAVRAALTAAWPPPLANRPVIVHGDYWPGNVLWRDGRLAGIVDWEDAVFGDPLADLCVTRLELCWFFGRAAACDFTDRYLASRPDVDTGALPLWDLWAALRPAGKIAGWGLNAGQRASMTAAHREFVTEALGLLSTAKLSTAKPGAAKPGAAKPGAARRRP
jgi:aminoglycoside phosphotransferase (APT) family kinase protein